MLFTVTAQDTKTKGLFFTMAVIGLLMGLVFLGGCVTHSGCLKYDNAEGFMYNLRVLFCLAIGAWLLLECIFWFALSYNVDDPEEDSVAQ